MADGARKGDRVQIDVEVVWALPSRGTSGRGRLVDVSATGVCLSIPAAVATDRLAKISLVCSKIPALPSTGEVMWMRSVRGATMWGVRFLAAGATWTSWLTAHKAQAAASKL
jgi:hypothetical protein